MALLALVTPRRGARWVLAGLLLAGSLTGYYMSQFGVVMDPDMIRNVLKGLIT